VQAWLTNPNVSALQVTAVPAFEDNYLWLVHGVTDTTRVVAVDPGDARAVNDCLRAHQWQLAGILVTHRHADHVGGVAQLQSEYSVPLYGPLAEAIPGMPNDVADGDQVVFAGLGLSFTTLVVPGHTSGHVAYWGHQAVFCGDTLFSAGCGRLLGGTAEQMTTSLARLKALPADTQVYCAHEYTLSNLKFALAVEPDNTAIRSHWQHCQTLRAAGHMTLPSTLELEHRINPFLRLSEQSVKQAAERQAGHSLHSDVETFAVLREWKKHFRG